MRIEQFDPETDIGSLRACYQIHLAAEACDTPDLPPPSYPVFEGAWAQGFGLGEPRETWLALDASGEPVGCYLIRLPVRENPTVAFCHLIVPPGRRRAGTGSELLEHCASRARETGRVRLQDYARDGSAGAAFARAKGATPGIGHVSRVMDVDAGVAATLSGLRADAQRRALGYEILSWQGPVPAEHLDQVVALHRLFADSPQDEGIETMLFDADRLRRMEQVMLEKGVRSYTVLARHADSGRLVALTEVVVDPETPGWAFQQLTAVMREHRGHRLGLLVKIAMLDLLAELEPDLKHISTGNAGANDHMIAINEQLGFRIAATSRYWDLDLAG
jgi:GNAT superfamily N-acetyltransferase/RimJ/RimL family protein N-acetyltransferase